MTSKSDTFFYSLKLGNFFLNAKLLHSFDQSMTIMNEGSTFAALWIERGRKKFSMRDDCKNKYVYIQFKLVSNENRKW